MKMVIGDVVAHLKLQICTFHQICNVLFHHYSASSILLSMFFKIISVYTEIRCLQQSINYHGRVTVYSAILLTWQLLHFYDSQNSRTTRYTDLLS